MKTFSTAARLLHHTLPWNLALLFVATGSSALADTGGFADWDGTTNVAITGGAGGPTVTVTNELDLTYYVHTNVPYVVQILGTITTNLVEIKSDKTIIGLGTNATVIGRLKMSSVVGEASVTNVMIRNLYITNPFGGDGISMQNRPQHVWVDHCTFYDCGDGEIDITEESDWITVSWCKFYYTFDSGHNFVNLIGSNDSYTNDIGKLHVTFHHNWWSTLCIERMPRVRYGRVHVYNNYYNNSVSNNIVNKYCVAASTQSEIFVEKNVFERVDEPYKYYAPEGLMYAVSNTTINCTHVISANDSIFTPPYAYTMDETNLVADIVTNNAGAGILDFSPPVASFAASQTNGFEPMAVTFTNTSTGTQPLNLFWDFGDSTTTNTVSGDNVVHSYAAGTFTVALTASNQFGTSSIILTNLITAITPTPFQAWQLQYFHCTDCPQAADTADPDGDGQNNQAEFLLGTCPTNSLSALRITLVVRQGNDVAIGWATAGGRTNIVQAAPGGGNGNYTNNFVDLSAPVIIGGSGDATTNYTDIAGATNRPSRFYRIRFVP